MQDVFSHLGEEKSSKICQHFMIVAALQCVKQLMSLFFRVIAGFFGKLPGARRGELASLAGEKMYFYEVLCV